MMNKRIKNNKNILNFINSRYNLLRIILFDLLQYYYELYNYRVQYSYFLSYVKNKYPQLFIIYKTRLKIYTINHYRKKKHLKLPPNTILVVGINNYYKYKAIKILLTSIFNYEKKIISYLSYLEHSIIMLIKSMNKFHQFYNYSINILFESNNNNIDDDDDDDGGGGGGGIYLNIDNAFNNIKRNYFSKNMVNILRVD